MFEFSRVLRGIRLDDEKDNADAGELKVPCVAAFDRATLIDRSARGVSDHFRE